MRKQASTIIAIGIIHLMSVDLFLKIRLVYWGGSNVYAYAENPVGWIDPLGLTCLNRSQAFNNAKDIAGIPRVQQAQTHWSVGGNQLQRGMPNYVYTINPASWGNFYQYRNATGELRVIVEHTNDPRRGPHFHAGKAKGNDPRNYDFKKTDNRYQKIDFVDQETKKVDHHIDYCK